MSFYCAYKVVSKLNLVTGWGGGGGHFEQRSFGVVLKQVIMSGRGRR
jgi:hypothetical protein